MFFCQTLPHKNSPPAKHACKEHPCALYAFKNNVTSILSNSSDNTGNMTLAELANATAKMEIKDKKVTCDKLCRHKKQIRFL